MKKHLTTTDALTKGKKAYRKPALKSFGQVSVLTRSLKGSIGPDADDEQDPPL